MIPEPINKEIEALEKNQSIRESIIEFESQLAKQDGAFWGDNDKCPVKHSFSDGIYVREIFIPKGTYIVGKLHKHAHPNFLMSGTVDLITEFGGKERLIGPLSMISKAGTKRALFAVTDCVWITVHENKSNTQDLNELEKIVIADSYEDYDKFISEKSQNKLIGFIKKLLKGG